MSESRQASQVRRMFGAIAPRYDLMNHLLSGNQDRRWRRIAAREVADERGGTLLDLCGGTGDQTLELARACRPDLIVCCDFSHPMLRRALAKFERRPRADRCRVLEADGLRLPLPDGCMDAVFIAFGVRNFEDLDRGLREVHRVLKSGGRLVVLEFSTPTQPLLAGLYRFYLRWLLPRIGDGIARRQGPYGYLARTIAEFPDQARLAGRKSEERRASVR